MAFGNQTFSAAGSAVGDIFGGMATKTQDDIKAQGLEAEGEQYDMAATLARQNEDFTRTSTALQVQQQQRSVELGIGSEKATTASAGFAESGTALDLLRSSAQQGALQKAVLGQQGLIKEAGYEEQAKSYDLMAATSKQMAQETEKAGDQSEMFGFITGGIKFAAAAATFA